MRLFIFSLLACSTAIGQTAEQELYKAELRLTAMMNQLREAEDDDSKQLRSEELMEELKEALQLEGAFEHPFDSLKTIGSIESPDDKIRIFNWNVERSDMTNEYHCLIAQMKGRKVKTFELKKDPMVMVPSEYDEYNYNRWYGALYYRIVPVKLGAQTYYTLFGYDAFTSTTQMKILDVMYFKSGKPRFGHPMFEEGGNLKNRVVFQYSDKAAMKLNYDDSQNKIIFDHLEPETAELRDFPEYMVPTMSYDAFTFMGKTWVLEQDVVATSPKNKLDRKYIPPSDQMGGGKHDVVKPEKTKADPAIQTVAEGEKATTTKKSKKKPKIHSLTGGDGKGRNRVLR